MVVVGRLLRIASKYRNRFVQSEESREMVGRSHGQDSVRR